MRVALGASRARIVVQLFIEMLVLSAAAAFAALLIVHAALSRTVIGVCQSPGGNPFWMDLGISTGSAIYAGALALLAATIAGIVPAVQATGNVVQSGPRALGGGGGLQLGKIWSAMIVTQVALAVLVLPWAVELGWGLLRPSFAGPGFPAEAYMTASVHLSGGSAGDATVDSSQASAGERLAELQSELLLRLEAEPGIAAVAVSQSAPGAEPSRQAFLLERTEGSALVDESDRADAREGIGVAVNRVASGFFEAFDVPLLAGRGLGADDFEPLRNAIVVNRTFAEPVAGDEGGALGRRTGTATLGTPNRRPGTRSSASSPICRPTTRPRVFTCR